MVGLNLVFSGKSVKKSPFTFQYGGIKLNLLVALDLSDLFTFQYGGIKLAISKSFEEFFSNLHSSMVGLNRDEVSQERGRGSEFTFQYGGIKPRSTFSKSPFAFHLHSSMVGLNGA